MRLYRILAIHAHPDDLEILVGGSLALLAEQGHSIRIVTMTPGDCGSREFSPEETATVRRREASAAAALIKAEYRCAEFRDLALFNDDDSRRRVTEVLREAQPEIVITAPPVDYHCDHEATSALVRDACFAAPAPNYKTRGSAAPIDHIPHLYFTLPSGGVDREENPITPDFMVDVAAVFETKRAMLACHESQRNWLRAHHGVDEYLDMMERWTRESGKQAGLEFGEGFTRYKGQPYPQTPVLEELLGSRVRLCGDR